MLVVDDEPELVDVLCESLRDEGFEVTGFTDPAAALGNLLTGRFDLLLSDLNMPSKNGITLLKEALAIDPHLVGIIMTGQGSIETAVDAMRTGAIDFVLKPFRMEQSLPVLERAMQVRRVRDESERFQREVARLEAERIRLLEESNARLAALATSDALTGLANRRAFDEALAREFALAKRHKRPLSLVAFDVDHFKSFNDEFGHPAGDEALKQVADVISECCRESDVAARYGGEEFALLLPATDANGAVALAERIRAAVEAKPWRLRRVTVSAGVAVLGDVGPAIGSPAEIIATADHALYRAKHGGRNRVASGCST